MPPTKRAKSVAAAAPTVQFDSPMYGSMRGVIEREEVETHARGSTTLRLHVRWTNAEGSRMVPTDWRKLAKAPTDEAFLLCHTCADSVDEFVHLFTPAGGYSVLSAPPPGCRWLTPARPELSDLGWELDEERLEATMVRLNDPDIAALYAPGQKSYPAGLVLLAHLEMHGGTEASRGYISRAAYAYNDAWVRKAASGKRPQEGEIRALEHAIGEVKRKHALWGKTTSGGYEYVAGLWRDAFDGLWALLLMLSRHADGGLRGSWSHLENPERLEKMCASVALAAEAVLLHPSAAYDWGPTDQPPRADGGIALFELIAEAAREFECQVEGEWADKKAAAAWAKVTGRAKAIREKGTEATGKTHTTIAMQPMLHAMLAGTTGKKKAHKRTR
jgi:hypothetical protein